MSRFAVLLHGRLRRAGFHSEQPVDQRFQVRLEQGRASRATAPVPTPLPASMPGLWPCFTSPDAALGTGPLSAIGCNTLLTTGQLRHTGPTSYTITDLGEGHTTPSAAISRRELLRLDKFLSRDNPRLQPLFSDQRPALLNLPSLDRSPIQDLVWMLWVQYLPSPGPVLRQDRRPPALRRTRKFIP